MLALLLRYRTFVLVVLHLGLVAASYTLAYLIRFEWEIPTPYLQTYLATLPLILVLRLVAFAHFRLYRGWWRYVGMHDLYGILKAIVASSALFLVALIFLGKASSVPRSILLLDPILAVGLISGMRFLLRAVRERQQRPVVAPRLRRVLIIGAGDAGELLLREMNNNPRLGYIPVGFVDDDKYKTGFRIHGVEVLGTSAQLNEVLARHPADELIIAIPSASREQIQAIVDRCIDTRLPFKIIPAIAALRDGSVQMSEVRPVRIEDLLGREPVHLDETKIRSDIAGRRVLITGAGGSIGSELARQVASYGPKTISLVERSENALYLIEQELRRKHPEVDIRAVLCDITDRHDLERAYRDLRPELVYHAAAYKHVPMMENHVGHAVRNNVFGTLAVAEMAAEHGAKFVLISTDKAVAPSNVMGATKRLAEKIVLSLNQRGKNHFVAVRFGNVLGSNGSVVPLFQQQIADGGPVTVTHPETTRYFMTIPEAVQLVLQSSVLEEARDHIVMLEMGRPVKIVDLARNLIRLTGLEPDVDLPIVFTGLRPGEKLHEQLTSDCEETIPTRYEKIRVVATEAPQSMERGLTLLWEALQARDERMVVRRMQELVPEFAPQASLLANLRDRLGAAEPLALSRTAG